MAPLQKQVIQFPFSQGVDTKTDPKQLQAPKVVVLQDMDFESPGQLAQRPGFSELSQSKFAGGSVSSGDYPVDALANSKQIALRCKDTILTYSDTKAKWFSQNAPTPMTYSKTVLAAGLFSTIAGYTANASYEAFAYFDGDLRVIVRDKSDGTVAYSGTITISLSAISMCICNNQVFIYAGYTAFALKEYKINLTTMVRTDTTINFDNVAEISVAPLETRQRVMVAYRTTANDFYVFAGDAGGGAVATIGPLEAGAHEASPFVTTKDGSSAANDRLFVFYTGTASVTPKVKVYDANLNLIGTGTSGSWTNMVGPPLCAGVFRAGNINGTIRGYLCKYDSANTLVTVLDYFSVSDSGVVTSSGTSNNLGPINSLIAFPPQYFQSKIFATSVDIFSQNYITVTEGPTTNAGDQPEAVFGGGLTLYPVANGIYTDTNAIEFVGLEKLNQVTATTAEYRFAKYRMEYAFPGFASFSTGKAVLQDGTLYMAGPQPLCFDGRTVCELGFNIAPTIFGTVRTGAGSIAAGTYSYVGVHEWYDANGNLHRSAPSSPDEYVLALAGTIRVSFNPIAFTGKTGAIGIGVYRTTDGGSTYYRVGSLYTAISGLGVHYSLDDNLTDAEILSNAILYTTGDVLPNAPPPASTFIHAHGTRILLVSGEDENKVLVSKTYQPLTAPEFNEDVFIRFAKGSYGVKALATLDEKLIAFKTDKIYAVVGDGPNDLGQGSSYTDPQEVQCDTGISEVRSVISFPGGVIFKTVRGWYLLDRGMNVKFIGAEVSRFNSLVVSGAVLVPSRNQVRLFHYGSATLVYDYIAGLWSVATGQEAIGACIWNGTEAYVTSAGLVRYKASNQWLEGTSMMAPKVVTSWISLGGIQGFQRIYEAAILGELRNRHTMRVRVGYDFDPAWKEEYLIDSNAASVTTQLTDSSYYGDTTSLGGQPDKTLQYKIRPYIQKCQSIRFQIELLNPGYLSGVYSNTELARISGIALTVGVKGGTKRLEVGRVPS